MRSVSAAPEPRVENRVRDSHIPGLLPLVALELILAPANLANHQIAMSAAQISVDVALYLAEQVPIGAAPDIHADELNENGSKCKRYLRAHLPKSSGYLND